MFLQTQLAADIKMMRSRISQNIAQNASAASGIVWFDNMTEYINILEVIQDALAGRIVQVMMILLVIKPLITEMKLRNNNMRYIRSSHNA
jgi:hypothetical protein